MSAQPADIVEDDKEPPLAIYAAPFARYGVVRGVDMALIDQQLCGLGRFSETGHAAQQVRLFEDVLGNPVFKIRWAERRHNGTVGDGRTFRLALHVDRIFGVDDVRIANCRVNNSPEGGWARATRDVAAGFGQVFGTGVRLYAVGKGQKVWLSLGGQPDADDLERLNDQLPTLPLSQKGQRLAQSGDFIGLRQWSPDEFDVVSDALGAWDGGWTPQQASTIAAKVRSGPR